jgi:hypothetical protein
MNYHSRRPVISGYVHDGIPVEYVIGSKKAELNHNIPNDFASLIEMNMVNPDKTMAIKQDAAAKFLMALNSRYPGLINSDYLQPTFFLNPTLE